MLEQQSNASSVILTGDIISNIVKESPKPELKENIASVLSRKVTNIGPNDISDLSLLGKDKNSVKLTCSSEIIKKKLVSSAKRTKSPNLYINEFLTKKRYELFQKARLLRKKYPSSNLIVYTRFGDVFYKISREGRYQKLLSLNQISALEKTLEENFAPSLSSGTSITDCPVSRTIASALSAIEHNS